MGVKRHIKFKLTGHQTTEQFVAVRVPKLRLTDLGEFGAIKRLIHMATRQRLGPVGAGEAGFRLLVDAGDDTAAWQTERSTELFTTDTMVEGVHFTRETTPWSDLGWKIMAANISDIASMGGAPMFALVTLGMPPETEIEDMDSLYEGMLELGGRYGVAIVGGDMVRSPTVFITLGLTGVCVGMPMRRSTAIAGDLVAVTGYLGSSAGGLEVLLGGMSVPGEAEEHLKTAHRRPTPCVSQGATLIRNGVRTAMDISDGLLDDLSKLCQASGVAASLESQKIPVHPLLRQAIPQRYLDLALNGGEDYQLVFAAPSGVMERVLPALPAPASVVGAIVDGEAGRVTVVDTETGEPVISASAGWDHFRQTSTPCA